MYQSSTEYKCLRLIAVLAHHSGAIHTILFTKNRILSGSDDMSVGIVNILPDGSLMLSKLLQGHVSRVRALDYQADQVLSGSDDRSVKLWSLSAGMCILYVFGLNTWKSARSDRTLKCCSDTFKTNSKIVGIVVISKLGTKTNLKKVDFSSRYFPTLGWQMHFKTNKCN